MHHGSKGSFEIVLDFRKTNVKIDYELVIEKEENIPPNIIYSSDIDGRFQKYNSLKEFFKKINFAGTIDADNIKQLKYKIYWEWPYENYLENENIDEEKDKKDLENTMSGLDYIFYLKFNVVQSR